jgi:hypothetical protein
MKHIYLPALLLIFSVLAHAGDVDHYMYSIIYIKKLNLSFY